MAICCALLAAITFFSIIYHGAYSYHGNEKEKSTARTQNKGRGCPATEKQEVSGPCSST